MGKYLLYGLAVVAALAILLLFRAPLKWGVKLLLNTVLGLALLYIFNLFGKLWGVTLGLNLINGVIVGVFGPIGLLLLLILRLLTI